MADGKLHAQALETIKRLCAFFDSKNYRYDKSEDGLGATISFSGDDFPMKFSFRAYDAIGRLDLLSFLPFKIVEDKRVDAALATAIASDRIAGSTFTFNLENGEILFKTFTYFSENSIPDSEVFSNLMYIANYWVEEYNDKYFMLNKGMIKWSDFSKKED